MRESEERGIRECEGAREECVWRLYRESDGKCSRSHRKTARFRLHGDGWNAEEYIYRERDRERIERRGIGLAKTEPNTVRVC